MTVVPRRGALLLLRPSRARHGPASDDAIPTAAMAQAVGHPARVPYCRTGSTVVRGPDDWDWDSCDVRFRLQLLRRLKASQHRPRTAASQG